MDDKLNYSIYLHFAHERAHLIMKASLHTKRQLEIDRDRGAAVGSLAQQYRLQL